VLVLIALVATPALAGVARPLGHSHGKGRVASGRRTRAPYRQLVWRDEFSGRAGSLPNPSKWQIETGGTGWGNNELQYYTASPSNVSLDGAGHLAITARSQVYGDSLYTRAYTSGLLVTDGRFQTTYGRIEARIKLPAGAGLWPAFWMVGTDSNRVAWPYGGEVDVMETTGSDIHRNHVFIHGPASYNQYGYNLEAIARSKQSLAAGFHIFDMDWSPGKMLFTLDGKPYATRTARGLPAGATWVFNQPFYLILSLAVGGNFPGPPNASTRFPATMLVDWVRVYSY
jgi:beta-glucanase (GH16 family)